MPEGEVIGGAEAMRRIGLEPFVLGPKEGLALLNGTQVSTALALAGLFDAEDVFAAGLMAGALSLEAIQGSIKPFDARIHAARGQPGQIAVAAAVRTLLEGSEIVPSHADCGRVQDPVLGALHAAGDGRLPRQPRACRARAGASRPMPPRTTRWCSRHRRRDLGRQLPRRARGLRGRHHRAGREPRSAPSAERRIALLLDSGPVGPAAVPGARRRPQLRLHDRAGHGGGAGLREQVARASRPASTACRPRPTRKTTCRWPPSRAAASADMVDNTAVVVGIEAMAAAQGIELKRGLKSSPLVEAEFAAIRRTRRLPRTRPLPRPDDRSHAPVGAARPSWPAALLDILPSHA